MLMKIKQWFSVENNVGLVRDILFVGSLLLALFLGLSFASCAPVAHAAEITEPAVPTNIINRFKMAPYIDIDAETGLSKYDGKYFTGELLDYWVLFQGPEGDYYLYTYCQHGDDYTTDGPKGEQYTYTVGLYHDSLDWCYSRYYVTQETLYHCDGVGSEWVIAQPTTPFNQSGGAIIDDSYRIIGSTMNIMESENPYGFKPHYTAPRQQGQFGITDYTLDMSEALFGVAKQAIDFIVSNPIILISTLLFIFVAGAGIVKTYVTGV